MATLYLLSRATTSRNYFQPFAPAGGFFFCANLQSNKRSVHAGYSLRNFAAPMFRA